MVFLFGGVFSLFGVFLVWCFFFLFGVFSLFGGVFSPCLVFFFLFGGVFFPLFGVFFPCLVVSHHAQPKPPSKSPRNPKTSATLFHVERPFSLGYRGLCS